jgi:hypothetical protein
MVKTKENKISRIFKSGLEDLGEKLLKRNLDLLFNMRPFSPLKRESGLIKK